MNPLKKATSDKRIQLLLKEISAKVRIKYQKVNDGGWGVNLSNDEALISYSGCKHPSASLAHELLHIDTQLRGFKRMRIYISSIDNTSAFKTLMDALDNELQHHKFYIKFLELGFTPDQFYQDSDSKTQSTLKKNLKGPYESIVHIIPDFLTAIAPGGSIPERTTEQLKKDFKLIGNGQYIAHLEKIEQLINAWARSDSFDAIPTVKEILLTIQPDNNLTWIGFESTDRPPEKGVFVDQTFTVKSPS